MNVTVWMALLAGVASFLSPCCLPLYPSYLSYMTGISVGQLKTGEASGTVRTRVVLHALCFSLGFSVIFFTMAWGAGRLSAVFADYRELIRQLSAILILVMGLFMLGIFQPQFLMKEKKWQISAKPAGFAGSFVIGIGFAAGWSPCVGPILSAILALSLTDDSSWLPLIAAYSVGFAVPFIGLALFLGSARRLLRYSGILMKTGGAVMVLVAILLYTGKLTQITIWFNSRTPDWLQF
ncbi:cytochrome c biogenesis CcdA family protein [Paenibacillus sp. YN15]|uniref:cytochrome c biogenesis CcdA family protein n=1 Tax=Paenibacillus sp. YN15 TaxID=1742774 RepID=UPI000DCB2D83|nr:cytochrome c biogenesis protein CcdA [Paenibacillus sp. YN15]RAV01004.1 cytochrome c biogenesis protein CcdA [Paenibacillus sp. YN15]